MTNEQSSQPNQPTTFTHADFLQAAAETAGVEPGELSERADAPPDQETDLLAVAKREQPELEAQTEREMEVELELQKQLGAGIYILHEYGLIERLPDGRLGFVGIDGKEYPVPSPEEIKAALAEQEQLLGQKFDQGFTQLLLVPIGLSIEQVSEGYAKALERQHSLGGIKGLATTSTEAPKVFNASPYADGDLTNQLIYLGGKTKREVLDSEGGWQVVLIEDLPDLPARGQAEVVGERKQLEAGLRPSDYLDGIKAFPAYEAETFYTLETWLTYALYHLEKTGGVIDGHLSHEAKGSYLIGTICPDDASIAAVEWNINDPSAVVSGALLSERLGRDYGARTMVRII